MKIKISCFMAVRIPTLMYDPLKIDLNGIEVFSSALTFMSKHPILKLGTDIGNVLKSDL